MNNGTVAHLHSNVSWYLLKARIEITKTRDLIEVENQGIPAVKGYLDHSPTSSPLQTICHVVLLKHAPNWISTMV